jgi:hypothetical protein
LFNELTKMFGGEKKNRRHSPRKKVRFKVSWISIVGEAMPAMGMEISLSGCLIATKQPPPTPSFDAVMEIGQRRIRVRLKVARSGTVARDGQSWTMLGCAFQGIAADDYDALARYFKDIPESENRLVKELASVDKSDDAYRLLPMRVQQRMLESLVRLGRLEMPAQNQQPLLRVSDLGTQDGKKRLAVHSRIPGTSSQEPQAFDTVILVDEAGIVHVES